MKNFARVIRLAFRYRYSILASLVCSFLVGLLWGGNIAALYPVVEVVFRGDSLHQWADKRLAKQQQTHAETAAGIETLQEKLQKANKSQRTELEAQLEKQKQKYAGEKSTIKSYRKQQKTVHRYLPGDPFQDLAVVVAALMLGTILKSAFLAVHVILVGRIRQHTIADLRNHFFSKTLDMDLSSIGKHRTSGLLSRFTHDMKMLEDSLGTLFGHAVREPLKMLVCLTGAAMISWRLLLLSMIVTPLGILMIRWLNKSMKRTSGRSMDVIAEMYARLTEAFNGIKIVKAFTREPHEKKRYRETNKEYVRRMMRFTTYLALFKPVTEIMGITVVSLAILSGAYLILNQQTTLFGITISSEPLSPAALTLFFGMLAGAADPARKMSDIYANLIGGAAASDRIYQLIDHISEIPEPEEPKTTTRPHRNLEFQNLNFHYGNDELVLKDVNLQIPYGETVVLMGPNGCGKSTLANLILRFYDPVDGAICLDGVDLRDMNLTDLRSRISIVTQEPLLFDDTVLDNILYGKKEATEQDAIEAAKKAHAHQFIVEQLPSGYQTMVGQGGGWLSGGQRQRIALARAILRDPEILLLDEATSQIDLESEKSIHQALEDFARGRTTIIISHRLSAIALADRVVVMNAGRIIDSGTHEQLLARCELYRLMQQANIQDAA